MKRKFLKSIVLVTATMCLVMAPPVYAQIWNFDTDLDGWDKWSAYPDMDLDVVWDGSGGMLMTYADYNTGQNSLDHPTVTTGVAWDFAGHEVLEIEYTTTGFPSTSPHNPLVTILIQAYRTDASPAYCLALIDPTASSATINLVDDDTAGWNPFNTGLQSFTNLTIEFPEGNSNAPNASSWFGASVLIDRIELTEVTLPPPDCVTDPFEGDISGPEGVPDCVVDLYDLNALVNDWLICNLVPSSACLE